MSGPFPQPPKIVVLTGPGLSREAGFAPFDPASMPPGATIEDFVTRDGFARDPAKVHEFYNLRRQQLRHLLPTDRFTSFRQTLAPEPGQSD